MIKLKKKDTISKILSEKKIRNSKILLIRINRRTKNKTKYYSLTWIFFLFYTEINIYKKNRKIQYLVKKM